MTTFNPFVITNVSDGFSVQSQGFWQGDVLADPAQRFQIVAGIVDSSETLPMWGGIAVYEETPPATSALTGQASSIGRFTDAMGLAGKQIAGFSTFMGTFAAATTPQSTVPLQNVGGSFNFVRFGSLSRVVVKCSSAVVALAGSQQPGSYSWDVANQQLIPSTMGSPTVNATLLQVNAGNSATVSYDAGTGFATWNTTGNVAVILI